MNLTKEQVKQIEKNRNVVIDDTGKHYTIGHRTDSYGWWPIPDHWIEELEEEE